MATTSIAINITGRTADITKKLNRVNAQLSAMGSRATGTRAKMAGLCNSFTGIMGKASALSAGFLGIAAAIRAISGTIKTLANFGFEMSKVEAISGATGNTLKEMTALAREMGATTMYTATEAASALKFLSMAGFSAEQSMAALPATLDLAQAGTIDLGRAADIASNIMAAYKIEAEKTNVVVDDMVSIVNNANTNVQQLGDAMKYVGAAAAASGVTIPTTAAAIGVLSNAGMQGAMAGTGLRQVFIRLTNVTGASEDALKGMGLTLNQVNPQMVGLTAAITRLKEAGMTGGEAIRIFGARGAVAALNLAKGLGKYHELKDIMESNEGVARKTSRTMQDNLMGAFKLLKSAVQEAILAVGDKGFGGGLKDVIKTLTELVRIMAGTGDPLSEFHENAMKIKIAIEKIVNVGKFFFKVWVVSKIAAVTAALWLKIKALWALTGAAGITATSMRVLATAIAATGIGAAIVGVGWLVNQLYNMATAGDAAAASQKRLKEAQADWMKEKTTFKDDGEDVTKRRDLNTETSLPNYEKITSVSQMSGLFNVAKEIRRRAEVMKEDMRKASAEFMVNSGDIVTTALQGKAEKKPDDKNIKIIAKIIKDLGIQGGVTAENFQLALDKIDSEIKLSAGYATKMMFPKVQKKIRGQIQKKATEQRFKAATNFLERLQEESFRASGATDDSQSGKVALVEARKQKVSKEIGELEAQKSLTEEEGKRLAILKEREGVMADQLNFESRLLSAERSGSKALEEKLELEKKIRAEKDLQRKIELEQAEYSISKGILDDTTAFDLNDGFNKIKEITEKWEDATVLRATEVGSEASTDFLNVLKSMEKLEATAPLSSPFPDLKPMQELRSELFNQVEGAGGKMNWEAKIPEDNKAAEQAIARQVNMAKKMAEGVIGNTQIEELTKIESGKLITALEAAGKGKGEEVQELIATLREEFTTSEKYNPERVKRAVDLLRSASKGLDDQMFSSLARVNGLQDQSLSVQKQMLVNRRKDLNAINSIVNAENKSIDMQKRKLKLIGAKAGGRQLAEIEGKEQMSAHMTKFEQALLDKQKLLQQDIANDVGDGSVLTDKDIQNAMKDERALAAEVISQEMALKGAEGGKFGVSSLAKIGGGGGVGAGGDPLLNAAELANVLMEQAQAERIRASKYAYESMVTLKRLEPLLKKGDAADTFFVTQ